MVKSKSLKSGITLTLPKILTLLLFIILPVAGFYLGFNYKSNLKAVNVNNSYDSSSLAETANWKTHIDKQKFSIKYPSDWTVFPNIIGGIVPGFDGTVINSANKLEPHGETLAEEGQAGIAIQVVGVDKSVNESLLDYAKKKFSSPDLGSNDYTETMLGNMPAIKHVNGRNELYSGRVTYMINNNSWVYSIQVSIHNDEYTQIINSILSTFTFTN